MWTSRVCAYCAYVVTLSAVTASVGRIVSYQAHGIGFAERPDLYGLTFFLGYLGVQPHGFDARGRHRVPCGVRRVTTRSHGPRSAGSSGQPADWILPFAYS